MHSTKRFLMAAAWLAALTLGAGATVWAAQPPANAPQAENGEEQGEMGPGHGWIQALNLTPDQVAKLRQNRVDNRKQTIKTRADMQTLQVDLGEEAMKDKPDAARVQQLARQMGDLHAQMVVQRVKGITFMRSILTPEQKQKLDQMQIQHGGMGLGMGMGMRGMKGKGGRMRHGGPEGKVGPE